MENLTFIVVGFLVTFLSIGYFVILFLWPEWVGVSGKDSQKTLESHKESEEKSEQE